MMTKMTTMTTMTWVTTEDEDEDDTQKGGGDDIDVNITGMNLSNPNPFFNKLQKLEPSLFLQENEGGFSAYSRICPWNVS